MATPEQTYLENLTRQQRRNMYSNTPEVDTNEEDYKDFRGSLLGQGIGMLGAGIAGRDPNRVFTDISDMRVMADRQKQAQQQIQQSKDLMNPQSEISKRQRMLYSRFLGTIPEDVSASDLKDPIVLQGLQQKNISAQIPKGGGVRQVSQPKEEKESKEEQKNIQSFKEAITENQKFLKQVDDYSKLVKKIPISGGITEEGASKIAAAQALRGKLLLSLKNIEKTGALDQGMINVADGILGSADYTRESVVDARANQLKQTIKDDIESNYIKYGILGIQQGEDGNYYYVDKNNKPILKYQGNINGKN